MYKSSLSIYIYAVKKSNICETFSEAKYFLIRLDSFVN